MAAIILATTARNALADAITTLVDGGAGAGTLKVYTGTLNDLDPTGDTLLATFTLVDPSSAAAATGVATWDFDPDISATVAATGTAGWFLVEDSTGADVFAGDVGTSGASLNVSSTAWVSGGTVSLTTGTVTAPAS
jgi:hypothetical protein